MTATDPASHNVDSLLEATVFDAQGEKIGSASDVFLNDETGQPDFIDLKHGLFGAKSSIVPLRGHSLKDDGIHVAFSKDKLNEAPEIGVEGHLSSADRHQCFKHFEVENLADVSGYSTQH
ncbi:PRC-barrel domain-containing protein [Corynebacterium lubricantis]|uniref:PRC-barrel domain-containing protein n=1 Tax=Corynebacterium lubricantis TaxID=541095 RepID=UPI00036CA030|nr:PRC-barrel domain-containing protein [Corynebacterium lubricantis]